MCPPRLVSCCREGVGGGGIERNWTGWCPWATACEREVLAEVDAEEPGLAILTSNDDRGRPQELDSVLVRQREPCFQSTG